MASRVDLNFIQGDDTQLALTVTNDDGTPYNLTGKRIELIVKPYAVSPDSAAIFQLSTVSGTPPRITITNVPGGLATADLSDLLNDVSSLWYDTWVADVTDPELGKQTYAFGGWTVGESGSILSRPLSAPCEPWPIDMSCYNLTDVDSAVIARWQAVATQLLWALSGRRWGACPVTIRPCRRSCADGLVTGPAYGTHWLPYQSGGAWRNASVCGCRGTCSCGELCEVYLPAPIYSIIEVTIDGAVIDPADYRLDAPGMLVRQNGGCWPDCQDMSAPAGADGTFVVVIGSGLGLDAAGIAAVSELTWEFVKSCNPQCGACRLPQRVTSVTQQGIAAQFIDPQEFMKNGRTGLYMVDMWLNAVNPNSLPAPPRVRSPDFPGVRTTIIS